MPNLDSYAALFESGFVNTQHMLLAIAFALGVYGPLLGGLVATWMDGGREGLSDLWRRITNWGVGWHWYRTVMIIAFLLAGIPAGILVLSVGSIQSTVTLSYVIFAFLAQLLTSGIGEEPGWRGFLLPRLQARFVGEKYIWALGLLWAVWHYPIVIIQTLSMMQNVTQVQMVITILMQLAGATMSLIGLTFIYVWLYNRTQSVLLAIVFHALSNLFSFWLLSFIAEPQLATMLNALMPWAVVIFLHKRLGKEQFPGG
jgi:membrane protease YdiL (CAAX protease family)